MMLAPEGPLAVPLWINGHAYMTVTPDFFDVRNPQTGEVLRRTPLCNADEVAVAVRAAAEARPEWAASGAEVRQACLTALADAISHYGDHLSGLLAEESGLSAAACAAELAAATASLRQPAAAETPAGVIGILAQNGAPLSSVLRPAAAALAAGATLVINPLPAVPGILFALAELTGRVGFPPGVLNVVLGDAVIGQALAAHPDVAAVVSQVSGD
ncbi:MAG: hypothetical protein RIR00_1267 [Pseudomonadota bacterium]|jgi:acyl-CoA reductase-like NAD-dependent aldehyde dehydrogenase